MTDRWYCSLASGVWGPASKEGIAKILKQGYLHKKTWVRKQDDKEWIALAEANLFSIDEIPDSPSIEPKLDSDKKNPASLQKKETEEAELEPIDEEDILEESTSSQSLSLNKTANVENSGQGNVPGEKLSAAAKKSQEAISSIGERSKQALQSIDIEQHKQQAKATFNLYRLFWTRVLKSDFSVIRSTPEEIERLESALEPVESPLAQDYASWRRSMLMICILVLSISTLFNAIEIWTSLTDGGTHLVQKIQIVLLFLFQFGSVILCALAARSWGDLRKSRSQARFSWLIQFAGPFLLFLVPLGFFVDNEMVLAQLGLGAVITLAPKIFGLFPGLIRCSLTVKTLLPETSVPGWLGIIIAPFYALFLGIATIGAIQTSELLLGCGFALLAATMAIVILRAQLLLKPTEQTEASIIVKGVKTRQMIFQMAGIFCIAIYLFSSVEKVDWGWLSELFLFVFSFLGNVTLLTVVMSDFMLGMIRQGQLQSAEFIGTSLEKSLSVRLDDLAACGLTELEAGEAQFAAGLRDRSGILAKTASAHGAKLLDRARGKQDMETNEKTDSPPS